MKLFSLLHAGLVTLGFFVLVFVVVGVIKARSLVQSGAVYTLSTEHAS